MQTFDIRSQITPSLAPLFNELARQTNGGLTPHAPTAAYAFVKAAPQIDNDLWMSRVIALAAQVRDMDIAVFHALPCSGPLSAVQLYDLNARKLHFAHQQKYECQILDAAKNGTLGLEELSLISVRNLLLQHDLLNSAQVAFMSQRYGANTREKLDTGKGIWLGAKATVAALTNALGAIFENSQKHLDQIGLVLLAPNGAAHPEVIEAAKKFKNAVMIQYRNEEELLVRLRALKMRIFIEMHGMQNPASFVETLRYGVANTQLSWAGLPESCPAPFMDGQLLDSVLGQYVHASIRPIPLRCWLPPAKNFPKIVRGQSLGIWAISTKINASFLTDCSEMAMSTGRKLQIFTGQANLNMAPMPKHVEFVTSLEHFTPDVLLDTTPISGGHACLFALLNNIPVVTLPGPGISSRLGASILLNYGFSEGVANDRQHYKELVETFSKSAITPHVPKKLPWEFVETLSHFYP